MAITRADIEQATFHETRRKMGYRTDEVDEFLDRVAAEIDALNNEIADLKKRLSAYEQLDAPQVDVESGTQL